MAKYVTGCLIVFLCFLGVNAQAQEHTDVGTKALHMIHEILRDTSDSFTLLFEATQDTARWNITYISGINDSRHQIDWKNKTITVETAEGPRALTFAQLESPEYAHYGLHLPGVFSLVPEIAETDAARLGGLSDTLPQRGDVRVSLGTLDLRAAMVMRIFREAAALMEKRKRKLEQAIAYFSTHTFGFEKEAKEFVSAMQLLLLRHPDFQSLYGDGPRIMRAIGQYLSAAFLKLEANFKQEKVAEAIAQVESLVDRLPRSQESIGEDVRRLAMAASKMSAALQASQEFRCKYLFEVANNPL